MQATHIAQRVVLLIKMTTLISGVKVVIVNIVRHVNLCHHILNQRTLVKERNIFQIKDREGSERLNPLVVKQPQTIGNTKK